MIYLTFFSIIIDLICLMDSTFFKEFHNELAQIVKFLLEKVRPSEAIFFSPKRGDSLDKFLEKIKESSLCFSVRENYDAEIWKRHNQLMNGDGSWPSYEKDHCYPLLVRIMLWTDSYSIISCTYFRQYSFRLCGINFCWLTCVVACIECTNSNWEIGIAMYRLNWYCWPQFVDP